MRLEELVAVQALELGLLHLVVVIMLECGCFISSSALGARPCEMGDEVSTLFAVCLALAAIGCMQRMSELLTTVEAFVAGLVYFVVVQVPEFTDGGVAPRARLDDIHVLGWLLHGIFPPRIPGV